MDDKVHDMILGITKYVHKRLYLQYFMEMTSSLIVDSAYLIMGYFW